MRLPRGTRRVPSHAASEAPGARSGHSAGSPYIGSAQYHIDRIANLEAGNNEGLTVYQVAMLLGGTQDRSTGDKDGMIQQKEKRHGPR